MSGTDNAPATATANSAEGASVDGVTFFIQSSVPARSGSATTTPATTDASASPSSSTSSPAAARGKLEVKIALSSTVHDLKKLIAEKLDVTVDQQRLIHGGKVLKNEQSLESYKLKDQHTIHMVKSAQPAAPASVPAPSIPQGATGQTFTGNPLAPLMNATNQIPQFDPFAQLGVNRNDLNLNQAMLNNPEVQAQMNRMLDDPQMIDQLINSSPQLRNLPGARDIIQSPLFRQMLTNPQLMQNMMAMGGQGGGGGGPFGGFNPFGGGAPGGNGGGDPANLFNAAAAGGTGAAAGPQAREGGAAGATPSPGAAAGQQAPDFNALFGSMFGGAPGGAGGQPGTPGATGETGPGAGAGQRPDPQQMMNWLQGAGLGGGAPFGGFGGGNPFGGAGGNPFAGGAGGNPFAAFGGGFGQQQQPQQPADSRPPEERFQNQLAQLNEMGFYDAAQNIRALLATNGNVHNAVEYILGGGGQGP